MWWRIFGAENVGGKISRNKSKEKLRGFGPQVNYKD
jgi:hypothetical protein